MYIIERNRLPFLDNPKFTQKESIYNANSSGWKIVFILWKKQNKKNTHTHTHTHTN